MVMQHLWRRKEIQPSFENEAENKVTFRRALGPGDLTLLGIGTIVGAGIFSLTGSAAALYAGPGVVYSFLIGAVLCAFAGLCYAELAAMVPTSGSAYAYTYATMGELLAWIIGWDLVLEYAFSASVVASSWSGYFDSLAQKTLGIPIPDGLIRLTKGPWDSVSLANGARVRGLWERTRDRHHRFRDVHPRAGRSRELMAERRSCHAQARRSCCLRRRRLDGPRSR